MSAYRVPLAREPQRILIVKPSALGDVVHALPVLYLLRRRFPKARIDWLVGRAFAGILRGHPDLDDVVLFDRGRRFVDAAPDAVRLAADLHARQYDLAVDLQGLLRSALLTRATDAPIRVGPADAREGAPLFYTHHVPARGTDRHAVERYLDVAEALGCGRSPARFFFPVTTLDRDRVRALLAPCGERPVAVLLPGTNWATKRWPAEHFAALARELSANGAAVVVAGAADARVAAQLMPAGVLDLVGQTNLRELVALLMRASLVVTNDSGPMHVAAALGVPMVSLFGPTSEARTGPYLRAATVLRRPLPCAPCFARTCSHQTCLRDVTPRDVLDFVATTMG